jgi:predicted RecA/RadA family phage recombinase
VSDSSQKQLAFGRTGGVALAHVWNAMFGWTLTSGIHGIPTAEIQKGIPYLLKKSIRGSRSGAFAGPAVGNVMTNAHATASYVA